MLQDQIDRKRWRRALPRLDSKQCSTNIPPMGVRASRQFAYTKPQLAAPSYSDTPSYLSNHSYWSGQSYLKDQSDSDTSSHSNGQYNSDTISYAKGPMGTKSYSNTLQMRSSSKYTSPTANTFSTGMVQTLSPMRTMPGNRYKSTGNHNSIADARTAYFRKQNSNRARTIALRRGLLEDTSFTMKADQS